VELKEVLFAGYGGFQETMANILKPDPNFIMGNVVVKSYDIFGLS